MRTLMEGGLYQKKYGMYWGAEGVNNAILFDELCFGPTFSIPVSTKSLFATSSHISQLFSVTLVKIYVISFNS